MVQYIKSSIRGYRTKRILKSPQNTLVVSIISYVHLKSYPNKLPDPNQSNMYLIKSNKNLLTNVPAAILDTSKASTSKSITTFVQSTKSANARHPTDLLFGNTRHPPETSLLPKPSKRGSDVTVGDVEPSQYVCANLITYF